MARRIDVDPVGLAETVTKHNEYARTGVDPDFRRGENPFNSVLLGDPEVKPNPDVGPIASPPFVALRIYPSTLGTSIGLTINADAQVLDAQDRPIGGLYACGQDISPVMRGYYPGGGINIGPAIVFAYIAIRHVADGLAAMKGPSRPALEPAVDH